MRALGLVLVALLAACTWRDGSGPLPPGPVPEPDPAPVPSDPCDEAEATLCRLECTTETGASLCEGPTGVRFGPRCRSDRAKGIGWDADCLAGITDCSQVDAAASGELCEDGP